MPKFNPEKQSVALAKASADVAAVQAEIMKATVTLQKQLATAQAKERKVREAITEAMLETGTKSFENDLVKLTLVSATTRMTLDTAKIKRVAPEIYEKYSKTTDVKASVRITVKAQG